MNLKIGVGKYDVTGPCAELGFMGYWDFAQKGLGIHSRLYSRAFVFEDLSNGKSAAIVCADILACTQSVHQAVIKKLKEHYGDVYTEKNVLISGTHTHSGPGGYSHYFIYNASIFGFNEQNFQCIVEGIFQSIVNAHANKRKGKILIAKGDVEDCGSLRSMPAYENNFPDGEGPYDPPEFREMMLLKFVDENGVGMGSLNWFAVHPTNMGQKNKLISGDNKDYASYLFEREKAVVSAFANSCCGDVSPNMKYGVPDGIHDFERTVEFGEKQFLKAVELFDGAAEELEGNIDYRQTFVNMDQCMIDGTDKRTWPAAMGYGMTPGSSEDSEGVPVWPEGTTREDVEEDPDLKRQALSRILPVFFGIVWPPSLSEDYIEGHAEKPILAPLGLVKINGIPLVPSIMPLQLIKIGSLIVIAHPGEMTTMVGRRMRETILDVFKNDDVAHAVVATFSGAYSSYTTTREEYAKQHYEGASTLYGPWTFDAYEQEDRRLACAMRDGGDVDVGPQPPDLSEDQFTLQTPVLFDDVPWDKEFGDIQKEPNPSYGRGDRVEVSFFGAHPKNNLKTENTFFTVEKQRSDQWEIVYTDNYFSTILRWKRKGIANSIVTIEWDIPSDQAAGVYRIKYFGDYKSGWTGDIEAFSGVSREFTVS